MSWTSTVEVEMTLGQEIRTGAEMDELAGQGSRVRGSNGRHYQLSICARMGMDGSHAPMGRSHWRPENGTRTTNSGHMSEVAICTEVSKP